MKKLIRFILAFVLVFTLVGCGEEPTPTPGPDPGPQEETKVEKVVIKNQLTEMYVGDSVTLEVEITPSSLANKAIEWSSTDSNVISVNNGKLEALKAGEATIKAKVDDKEATLTIKVVEKLNPELIVDSKVELFLGEEVKLNVELKDSTDAITYSSDKEDVATVTSEGLVKGLKVGTANLTVKAGALEKKVAVEVKANTVEITGVASLLAGSNLQLTVLVNGKEGKATWTSNETNIATVDANGLVSALSEGTVVIKATLETKEEAQVTLTVESNTVKPTALTLTSNASDIIYIDTEIKIDYEVTPVNASRDVVFTSSDEKIAKVDKNGNVRFYKGGTVVITCTSKLRKGTTASITLTTLDYVDPMAFFTKYNVGTVHQQYVEKCAYSRDPHTVSLLAGCVSYYYFAPFEIIDKYAYEDPNLEWSYGPRTSTWYVCVHDSGGASTGLDLAVYAAGSARTEGKSWHFSVSDLGVWRGLNEEYAGWHAGDGSTLLEWFDTGIEANPFEPHANVTISDDQYWVINGVKSELKVRIDNPGASGIPSKFNNIHLPMTGINTRIGSNGTYLIGSVWWSNTYKTLSNRGGNKNSIGMETSIDDDCDLEICWHNIAKLCTYLVVRRNLVLGLDAIVQHNTFSGKNCPQTMRDSDNWPYFKMMCEAEFYARKYLEGFNFEFICNSDLVNDKGQVIKFPEVDTEITYQVRVTSATYNYDKTTDAIKVTIPASIPVVKVK